MYKKVVAGIVPGVLVLLFSYTAINKFADLENFTAGMYNQPIPHPLAYALARIIPTLELIAAACLLINKTQKIGFYLSFILMTIFTGYVILILAHTFRKIPCSCAGIFRHISWQLHLWINLALLAITILPLIKHHFHSPLKQPL